MREVAWRGICRSTGRELVGDLVTDLSGPMIRVRQGISEDCFQPVLPESVKMYTGMIDINCRQVFEGDVLNHPCMPDVRIEVVWRQEEAGFALVFHSGVEKEYVGKLYCYMDELLSSDRADGNQLCVAVDKLRSMYTYELDPEETPKNKLPAHPFDSSAYLEFPRELERPADTARRELSEAIKVQDNKTAESSPLKKAWLELDDGLSESRYFAHRQQSPSADAMSDLVLNANMAIYKKIDEYLLLALPGVSEEEFVQNSRIIWQQGMATIAYNGIEFAQVIGPSIHTENGSIKIDCHIRILTSKNIKKEK